MSEQTYKLKCEYWVKKMAHPEEGPGVVVEEQKFDRLIDAFMIAPYKMLGKQPVDWSADEAGTVKIDDGPYSIFMDFRCELEPA